MASTASLRSFLHDRRATIVDLVLAIAACWAGSAIYFSHESVLMHYGVVLPLSSDNVAPYLLFDDLFQRHLPMSGWMFPEAPFFVPDIALAWLAYLGAGSLVGAVGLYALISASAFVWLVRAVLLRAGYGADAWRLWLAIWLVGCSIGVVSTPSWFSHLYGYVFIPYIHSGMLIGVVAGLALLLGVERAREPPTLVALTLLAVPMLVSDRLFALQFVLPALAVGAWMVMRKSPRFTRVVCLLAAILIASEAWLFLHGAPFATESNDRTPIEVSLRAFVADLGTLAVHDPFNTLVIVAGFAATAWSLRRARGEHAEERRVLAAFALSSTVLPVVVALALGRYHSVEELRYFQSAQLLALPLAGMLAGNLTRIARVRTPIAIACALVLTIVVAPILADARGAALRAYLVEQETCLRGAIAREHLGRGAATYWRANEMTARFPESPAIVPLSVDVAPRMRNIVNLGWLSPLDANAVLPPLEFVDEFGYTQDALDRAFGPASRRVACPRSAYRIYARDDGALSRLYRFADWLPSQLLQRIGVANVPAAAWAAEEKYVAGDAVHAAGRFTEPAIVAATAIDIPKGAVDVQIAYRLRAIDTAAAVRWQVAIVDEHGALVNELGSGVLEPAADERRVALPLGARGHAGDVLGISLSVAGDLELDVARVRVAVR